MGGGYNIMTRIYPLRDNKSPLVCECTHSVNDHTEINLNNPDKECSICECPKFDEMTLNYTEQDMMK